MVLLHYNPSPYFLGTCFFRSSSNYNTMQTFILFIFLFIVLFISIFSFIYFILFIHRLSRWKRAIFGHHLQFSMTKTTKRCSSISDLRPLVPNIYSPKFAQNRLQVCRSLSQSQSVGHGLWLNEIWARRGDPSPTGLSVCLSVNDKSHYSILLKTCLNVGFRPGFEQSR